MAFCCWYRAEIYLNHFFSVLCIIVFTFFVCQVVDERDKGDKLWELLGKLHENPPKADHEKTVSASWYLERKYSVHSCLGHLGASAMPSPGLCCASLFLFVW